MNHRKLSMFSILMAAAIILSACASATPAATVAPIEPAAPQATAEPLVCPTAAPEACPTTALQSPSVNEWRWGWTKDVANVIVTFDPGDKCSLEFIKPTDGNALTFDIVVNDQAYENYVVAILSLEEGKGIKDLEAYHKLGGDSNVNPPPWSNLEEFEIVQPMSRTFITVRAQTSPLYFVCIVQGPGDQRVIEEFDGVPISKE